MPLLRMTSAAQTLGGARILDSSSGGGTEMDASPSDVGIEMHSASDSNFQYTGDSESNGFPSASQQGASVSEVRHIGFRGYGSDTMFSGAGSVGVTGPEDQFVGPGEEYTPNFKQTSTSSFAKVFENPSGPYGGELQRLPEPDKVYIFEPDNGNSPPSSCWKWDGNPPDPAKLVFQEDPSDPPRFAYDYTSKPSFDANADPLSPEVGDGSANVPRNHDANTSTYYSSDQTSGPAAGNGEVSGPPGSPHRVVVHPSGSPGVGNPVLLPGPRPGWYIQLGPDGTQYLVHDPIADADSHDLYNRLISHDPTLQDRDAPPSNYNGYNPRNGNTSQPEKVNNPPWRTPAPWPGGKADEPGRGAAEV